MTSFAEVNVRAYGTSESDAPKRRNAASRAGNLVVKDLFVELVFKDVKVGFGMECRILRILSGEAGGAIVEIGDETMFEASFANSNRRNTKIARDRIMGPVVVRSKLIT